MRAPIAAILIGCGGASESAAPVEADCGCAIEIAVERTFAISGTVRAFRDDQLLEGVSVCVQHHPEIPCVKTSADGAYRLEGAPAGVDDALVFTRAGLVDLLVPYRAREDALTDHEQMMASDDMRAIAAAAGATDPALGSHGIVAVNLFSGDARVASAKVSIEGEARGPFYVARNGTLDTKLTSSSETGIAVFLDVAPGNHKMSVTRDGMTCGEGVFSWADARTPVATGHISSPSITCRGTS